MNSNSFDTRVMRIARDSQTGSRRTLLRRIAGGVAATSVAARWSGVAAQPCEEPLVDCNGVCVDLSSDTYHCGQCGNACTGVPGPGQSSIGQCVDGVCQPVCLEDADYCGEQCTDLSIDQLNCGSCGNQCTPDQVCCDGRCISPGDAERFCGDCGFLAGWPQGCAENEECDGALCIAVETEPPIEQTGPPDTAQLMQMINDLEQRVASLEAERIPIDPSGPDAGTDYLVHTRDPYFRFGLVCTLEEQQTPDTGSRLECIRPAGLDS